MFSIFKNKKLNDIYLIEGFLEENICKQLVNMLLGTQFNKARQYDLGRHNKELFTIDEKLTSLIFEKIQNSKIDGHKITDFSRPAEFYRYDNDEYIEPHTDSKLKLPNGFISNFTALIYLNDDYFGGATYFTELKKSINPKAGTLLLFNHNLVHEGQKIIFGTKLIYRSNWHISAK